MQELNKGDQKVEKDTPIAKLIEKAATSAAKGFDA